MAAEHIASLYETLPEVFEKKYLPTGFDGYFAVESENSQDLSFIEFDLAQQLDDMVNSEGQTDIAWPWIETVALLPGGSNIAVGAHEVPIHPGIGGVVPPPDALAFYLEYHYFWTENLWGIYLKADGVLWLAYHLKSRQTQMSCEAAILASRRFLYRHELWHHNVECFATRLEVTHRRPLYKGHFESLYQRTAGSDDCLEESLANAYAFRETIRSFKSAPPETRRDIEAALTLYIKDSPPGYRRGLEFRTDRDWEDGTGSFAEENHAECGFRKLDPAIWNSFQYSFAGFLNTTSKFRYFLPLDGGFSGRIPLGRQIRKKDFEKTLKELGYKPMEGKQRGPHETWLNTDGRRCSVPRHVELNTFTARGILYNLGMDRTAVKDLVPA